MDLCNINEIKALLTRHGFHFSKAKGQNFLTQSWVPREIVLDAGIDDTCGVLEVGPGIGPLTQQLCRSAKKVVAVEVDRSLQSVLAETMAGNEILFADILKTDIKALVEEEFSGLRPMACANLPYYITTPVLAALLESRAFEAVTVMVSKLVSGTAEALMVPSKDWMPRSSRIALRRMELLSSSVNTEARLVVEDRLL